MSSWVVPGYTEIRPFAQGATGQVVLAWHDTTGTPVVIRYLGDPARTDPDVVRRVRSDARLMSEVDSPNVTRLYEYVESPAGAAIVMELVDGVSLQALLRTYGPTEPELALAVLKGSLVGLAAAHGRDVLHRDYRPETVLVDTEGRIRLTDFGLAVRGAAEYLAPEQWAGAPPSTATDIYAATATCYECLVGAPPAATDPIPAPVPGPLVALLARGLAPDPADRPASATAFLVELAAAMAGYGDDWEDRGREELSRRASVPTAEPTPEPTPDPPPAPSASPLTLSPPPPVQRSLWSARMLVGLATTLAVVVAAASCLAMRPDNTPGPPAAAGTPDAAPVVASPSPSAGETGPPATPVTTVAVEPAPPTLTRQPPTPTPASSRTVQGLRVTELRIDALRIFVTGRNPVLRVTVAISTTSVAQFDLNLHQEGSDDRIPGGGDTGNPTDTTFQLSGATSYLRTFNLPITKPQCAQAKYLLVSAVSIPGADNGEQLAVLDDPRC